MTQEQSDQKPAMAHHLTIDDLDVIFPYEYIYPEQKEYMIQMKLSLDAAGPSVIETPPGIGTAETIFSIYLAYMEQHEGFGPIVFVTNTYQNYLHAFESFKTVVKARQVEDTEFNRKISAISLGSKMMQCTNKDIKEYILLKQKEKREIERAHPDKKKRIIDIEDLCFNTTCSWTNEPCRCFENTLSSYKRINSIESFNQTCIEQNCCAFWSARQIINQFHVIFVSEEEILNPKTSQNILKRLPSTTAFIFYECNAIDATCCNTMSAYLTRPMIKEANDALKKLKSRIESIKMEKNFQEQQIKVQQGVKVDDVVEMGPSKEIEDGQKIHSSKFELPLIQADRVPNTMCGTLFNMEFYVHRFKYLLDYFEKLIPDNVKENKDKYADLNIAPQLLTSIFDTIFMEPLALYFLGTRLNYFIASMGITDISEFAALYPVFDFCTLLATYDQCISVTFSVEDPVKALAKYPVLQLSCLDASIAFSQITNISKCFMISSSTLCVPGFYPQLLGFTPITQVGILMYPRDAKDNYPIHAMTITHGNDQSPMRLSPPEIEKNIGVRRNIMSVLIEIARVSPDGMIALFPSMQAISDVVKRWASTNQHEELYKEKLVFVETFDFQESVFALDGFYRACDNGRGGILLCVAGGKLSRNLDLRGHYGRTIVVLGFPMDEIIMPYVNFRANYLDSNYQFPSTSFIKWNSLRNALASLSTILSSKSDYSTVLLVDRRYEESELRNDLLPIWLRGLLTPSNTGQGVEEAKDQVRKFFSKAHTFEFSPKYRVNVKDANTI